MARYRVELTPAAVRDLKKLDRRTQEQVGKAIDGLAGNPRPRGVKALQGDPSILRLRSGVFRILYRIEDREILILVIRIGHRKDVYRTR
jgi:mRNA interferase RelE/StbE